MITRITKETYNNQLAVLQNELGVLRMRLEAACDVCGGYDSSMDRLSEMIECRQKQLRDLHWDWLTRYWTEQDRAVYEQISKEG